MITRSLKVILWGREVGRLSWDDKRGIGYFEYGRERKYVIGKNKPEYDLIQSVGAGNLPEAALMEMAGKYLL